MNTQQNTADVPQYLVIRNYLLERMDLEELAPGKQLPSERSLSQRFKTTRVTAREALLALETEGRIFRVNRQGWFVSPQRLSYDLLTSSTIRQQAESQGIIVEDELLNYEIRVLTAKEQKKFGLNNAGLWQEWMVAYRLNNRLAVVEKRLAPAIGGQVATETTTEAGPQSSWPEMLKSAERLDTSIKPIALADELCSVFKVSAGAPGLEVKSLSYDQDEKLVAATVEVWRHDALTFDISKKQPVISSEAPVVAPASESTTSETAGSSDFYEKTAELAG